MREGGWGEGQPLWSKTPLKLHDVVGRLKYVLERGGSRPVGVRKGLRRNSGASGWAQVLCNCCACLGLRVSNVTGQQCEHC